MSLETGDKPGASLDRDDTLAAWAESAAKAAAEIGLAKIDRVAEWLDDAGSLEAALKRIRELARVLWDDDLVELNHQVTLAGVLYGMNAAVSSQLSAVSQTENSHRLKTGATFSGSKLIAHSSELLAIANSELFESLPFREAIDGLAERIGLLKYRTTRQGGEALPAFMELDAANRSRAFTMAWIEDLNILQQVHDELTAAITDGQTFADFKGRLAEVRDRTGWEGSEGGNWHYRLVYEQNLAMAYTAGRHQQGKQLGYRVVRILPTLSASPRPEHARYANHLFRVDDESPLPPWDFKCNCGWEWVEPEELEGTDVDSLPLLRFDDSGQQFKFRPSAYMALQIDPGKYAGAVGEIAQDVWDSAR